MFTVTAPGQHHAGFHLSDSSQPEVGDPKSPCLGTHGEVSPQCSQTRPSLKDKK